MAGNAWRRLWFWLRRQRIEAELREEIETHRSLREDALRRFDDPSPAAASHRALGNVTLAREDARGVWIWPWLESVALDLRHGLRSLRRRPTLTLAIFLTIAIGTAALTAAAAVAHTVLLKATPYDNADRIVQLQHVREGRPRSEIASVDIDAIRRADALEQVSFAWTRGVSLTGAQLPENARGVYTDLGLFPLLGTAPLLGRWPSTMDAEAATPPVVISHALWRRRYQFNPDVVGTTVAISGQPHVIVAVMPEDFRFPSPYYVWGELWMLRPPNHPSLVEPTRPILLTFGLLREGQSREAAQARLDAVAAGLATEYPATHADTSFRVTDWAGPLRRNARPTLLLLLGAAAMVFLIVCINVVNLLLCRGLDRAAEMHTRTSLGAGGGRLVRQLMTETTVLFLIGGLCGVVLASWMARAVATIAPFDIARMNETSLTWPVALAGLAVTLMAGMLVAWFPARRTVKTAARGPAATRSATTHAHGRRVQRGLIAIEIGLAVALGCSAVSIAMHASAQMKLDAGFDTTHVIQGRMAIPTDRYPDAAAEARVLTELLERLRSNPAIAAAAVVDIPPGVAGAAQPVVALDDEPTPVRVQDLRSAAARVMSDGYFETLGLRAVAGRLLRAASEEPAPVAVVNEAFVRTYLAGRDPLASGLRVTFDGLAGLDSTRRTIVGVVPDIPEDVLYRPAPPTVYVPVGQGPSSRMAIVARGRNTSDLGLVVREALNATLPNTAVNGLVMSLGDLMASEFARTKASMRLVGALAVVALGLAVIGVYGVIAHGVQHRSREIGIRLALGVTPSGIRRMVLSEGAWLLAIGVTAGSALAVWFAPVARSLMVGVDTMAVAMPLAIAAGVLAVAVLAGCAIPASRAAAVDPATALR